MRAVVPDKHTRYRGCRRVSTARVRSCSTRWHSASRVLDEMNISHKAEKVHARASIAA